MGDDQKMSKTNKEKIITEIKEAFLSVDAKAVRQRVEKKTDYFLNEEILKLKKKKNFFIPIIMLSFVSCFFLFSFFGASFIKEKGQEQDAGLGINDFATIDIQDVNFKIRDLKNELDGFLSQKDEILRRKKRAFKKHKSLHAFKRELLEKEEIDPALFEKKLNDLDIKSNYHITRLTTFFAKKFRKNSVDIAVIQQKILLEKKKNKNIIGDGDTAIDNNKKLMDLKIKAAVNLVLSDLEIAEENFDKILLERKKTFDIFVRNLKNKYENEIDNYRKSINYYMHKTGQVGIVLNIKGKILQLYIHPLYDKVKNNTKAHVIGKNDNLKAEILVRKKDNSFEGEVIKWISPDESSEKIESLDSIVLFL